MPVANFGHLLALTNFHVGFTKFGNDLIHCVTFLRHSESPFRAVSPSKILSLTTVQFYGGRSGWDVPLIVSSVIKAEFENAGVTGAVFEKVS
jgi:hypothetical protein